METTCLAIAHNKLSADDNDENGKRQRREKTYLMTKTASAW